MYDTGHCTPQSYEQTRPNLLVASNYVLRKRKMVRMAKRSYLFATTTNHTSDLSNFNANHALSNTTSYQWALNNLSASIEAPKGTPSSPLQQQTSKFPFETLLQNCTFSTRPVTNKKVLLVVQMWSSDSLQVGPCTTLLFTMGFHEMDIKHFIRWEWCIVYDVPL